MLKFSLIHNLSTFEKAIQSPDQNVICDNKGNFYFESHLMTIIRKIVRFIFGDLFNLEARKYEGWIKGFAYVFDEIEHKHVEYNKSQFESYLKTAKAVREILKQNHSSLVKDAFNILKVRTNAFKYRLNWDHNPKYEKKEAIDIHVCEELISLAEDWKKTQIVFDTHELFQNEIDQLNILTQYPKFATLVKNDKILRQKFFDWALLAKNNVEAFIQFPHTVERLIQVELSERIGRYGGNDLQIEEVSVDGRLCKDLTLSFEDERKSILDDSLTVTLSYDYKLTIGEIFKIFEERAFKIGNVEYFGKIRNWNSNEWGAFNPAKNDYERIDVTDSDWPKKVPFSENISEEEARERFEDKDGKKLQFEPQDWVFTIVANNQYKHANMTGTHTMLCIAVPLGNGRRGLFYLSKFPWDFPDSNKEKKKYIRVGFDTLRGAIQLPDQNFYQLRRDVESVSFRATEEQARIILNSISKDKKKAEEGILYFQFLIYNCTDWVFKKLRHLMTPEERDELAAMRVWDAQPEEALTANLLKLPSSVRKGILNLSLKVAKPEGKLKKCKDGSYRKIELSVDNCPWKEGSLKLHPAMIILRKREKKKALAAINEIG